ncbi:MAG: hypothetical protein ACRDXX_05670 [Stackebrandtia sp.]
MRVHAADGEKWRVGRRVLPWRPRFWQWLKAALSVLGADEIALLVVPVAALLSVFWVLEAVCLLLAAPVFNLGQLLGWWPRRVVAYPLERLTWRVPVGQQPVSNSKEIYAVAQRIRMSLEERSELPEPADFQPAP